jgi:hypothetical protein
MLPSQAKTEAIEDVFNKLKQRKDLIKDKLLDLNLQRIGGVEYYQKAVKHGDYTVQPGAVKEVKYKKYKTELSIFVATMSLFSEDTEESMKHGFGCYINRNLEELYNELKEVPEKYKKIEDRLRAEKRIKKSIEHFNGFTDKLNDEKLFSRCFRLSRSRRERIFSKYNSEPIVLNNRNFRGRSKVCDFIDYNRNSIEKYKKTGKYSKINSFLNLGGICPGWKHLYIPIKHCNNYHGNLSDYRKNADAKFFNYQYIVIFKEN